MVSACLVATISAYNGRIEELVVSNEPDGEEPPYYDPLDGPSEEEAYLQGQLIDWREADGGGKITPILMMMIIFFSFPSSFRPSLMRMDF